MPPPAASQSPDSTPQRAAPAPPEAIAAPSAADTGNPRIRSGGARPAAPQRATAPAPPETRAIATPQSTAPKLDSGGTPPRRASVRVFAAKTGAAAPGVAAEALGELKRPEGSPAPAQPKATPAPAAPQEPVNPVAGALDALAGAIGAPAGDSSASKSGDWAIQFTAPKTEAEAAAAVARLNAKYAGALNGATIAVQKSQVNGETAYALRVARLSKAEAEALCTRVKGRDCSMPESTAPASQIAAPPSPAPPR